MNTTPKMQAAIEKLANKHTVDIHKPGVTLRLDMQHFDQLRIECLPNGCVSVAHLFEVQGHLVPEPDVAFFIDAQRNWVPIDITQSAGYIACAKLSNDAKTILRYDPEGQADLADFCEIWAQNLRDQGWLENAVKHQLPDNHRFDLGQVVMTQGAQDALEKTGQTPDEFISRHVTGDWGTLPAEDAQANEDALDGSGRLVSAYHLNDGTKIWLITEWDRSASTLLLPSEY